MSLPPETAADLERPLEADRAARSRLKWDLLTSYALTAARVGSNVAIFAILFRYTNERYAATYAVVRSMFMLLTYIFGGFNPALQRVLAVPFAQEVDTDAPKLASNPLSYSTRHERVRLIQDEAHIAYAHANAVASLLVLFLAIPVVFYGENFSYFHENPLTRQWHADKFAAWFGLGLLFRLWSEPSGAVLQQRNRLALDNMIQAFAELTWVGACLAIALAHPHGTHYGGVFAAMGGAFFLVSSCTLIVRRLCAALALGWNAEPWLDFRWAVARSTFAAALLVSAGQFADFLYAPANILLINSLIDPALVAQYAPALQVDAGLLLLVSAVSAVMLPRAMSAWARGERESLRRAYIQSTLACLFVLATAALVVGVLIEPILKLWLGTVPAQTPTITRLVLIHTVIGGTAGIGRSVLLGMGRFKAYTLSALLGGVANVALALLFVLVLDLGLRGIVLATVIAVTVRCAIWMPIYILRSLRVESERPSV
jgi:O-antigen/teichoic acid export membrane protein